MTTTHAHTPSPTYLKDYRQSDFFIQRVDLQVELEEEKATVYASLKMHRNQQLGKHTRPLVLDGEELKLISVTLNKVVLTPDQYQLTPHGLIIESVPDVFTLEIVNEIYPQKNTALSGLYRSKQLFCTQCEAQGFRRITYYIDRPDVMAIFTTTIVADKTRYPVLLANGNPVESGDMPGNRHWVKWEDPFKKPSYLFALVAGPLAKITDTFVTQSKRSVRLEIYVESQNLDKCGHAMESLKKAMKWDEIRYGREYDLDIYMIVAVNDFNMGAMENKGLNLFNAKYILANEATATDLDFEHIEAVIGHEYFHNWTGNRITCRDWFQLSLKEGLTVFREEQFSQDCGSAVMHRITQVKNIRANQFAEDAGPMAHPVQPQSYIEIDNFYTSTVYSKGSEVIRMLHTLLGEKGFRRGMDLYFERYDGQAVTIEDFLAAHADANNRDLNQFHRWYKQSGTPVVKAMGSYDSKKQQWILTLSQSCPPTPGQPDKKPFMIPVKIALYDQKGESIPLHQSQLQSNEQGDFIILTEKEQQFIFDHVNSEPIPSLFGNFSAPVKCDYEYTQEGLSLLAKYDQDGFNRWDALQRINIQTIQSLMLAYQDKRPLEVPAHVVEIYRHTLEHPHSDGELCAQLLMLPSFSYISETMPLVPVAAVNAARKAFSTQLAQALLDPFWALYHRQQQQNKAQRALKNVCLAYIARTGKDNALQLVKQQYENAQNMTDMMGALNALIPVPSSLRESLHADFYQKWQQDPLVVNKWLSLQAMSEDEAIYSRLQGLLTHPGFDSGNPNNVYALIGGFSNGNPNYFHDEAGKGYQFLRDRIIELNKRNPHVAARMLEPLTQWKRLDAPHSDLMREALLGVQRSGPLSKNVDEIVVKSL